MPVIEWTGVSAAPIMEGDVQLIREALSITQAAGLRGEKISQTSIVR